MPEYEEGRSDWTAKNMEDTEHISNWQWWQLSNLYRASSSTEEKTSSDHQKITPIGCLITEYRRAQVSVLDGSRDSGELSPTSQGKNDGCSIYKGSEKVVKSPYRDLWNLYSCQNSLSLNDDAGTTPGTFDKERSSELQGTTTQEGEVEYID